MSKKTNKAARRGERRARNKAQEAIKRGEAAASATDAVETRADQSSKGKPTGTAYKQPKTRKQLVGGIVTAILVVLMFILFIASGLFLPTPQ